MKFTIMGREFETDDAKYLIDQEGNSLPYQLSECYLRMERNHSLQMFKDTQEGDFVTFYGPEQPMGLSDQTFHPIFLLIRNGRVVEERRPYDEMMFD